MIKICQYDSCLDEIGERGVVVTLKTPDDYGHKQVAFCCVGHAIGAPSRLALDRQEETSSTAAKKWRTT